MNVVPGLTTTPVTGILPVLMVTPHVAVLFPSAVVTVIVADPKATPVTRPVELTVATAVLPELQLTALFVAFAGDTVAVNCVVADGTIDTLAGLMETPVTGTVTLPQDGGMAELLK